VRGINHIVRRLVGALFGCAIIGILLVAIVTGYHTIIHARALKQHVSNLRSTVQGGQGLSADTIATLRQEIMAAELDVQALKGTLGPAIGLSGRLGWLPSVGPSLQAVPHLVTAGENSLAAASALLAAAQPMLDTLQSGRAVSPETQAGLSERVLPVLRDAQPLLVEAQDRLEQAIVAYDQIAPSELIGPLAGPAARVGEYLPAARAAAQAASVAPLLLGAERPMTYLVLVQNNDELRPTGGFISAIGVLTLNRGRIVRMDFKDGYAVDNWQRDHPAPPAPFDTYMGTQMWTFRDSNFSPDFPTSAQAAEYFAALDLDLHPDGVIAADQTAVAILLQGLGPVQVPEDGNADISADDAIEKMRAYWRPHSGVDGATGQYETWTEQRKQYVSNLVAAMRRKLENDTRSIDMVQLGKAVLQALDEKHILIYLHPPLGNGLTSLAGWDGAITPANSDYLYVVDTNMGWNKANAVISRTIDYAVTIDQNGQGAADLTIGYTNHSNRQTPCLHKSYYEDTYDQMINRCYFNYLRIYVPDGSNLAPGGAETSMASAGMEAGKQVWDRWLEVPTQQVVSTTVSYQLSAPLLQPIGDEQRYHLVVQKQPGTDSTPTVVTVTLPVGMRVVSASPAAASIKDNVVVLRADLKTDEEFEVIAR
jgi:hypothetical protein